MHNARGGGAVYGCCLYFHDEDQAARGSASLSHTAALPKRGLSR